MIKIPTAFLQGGARTYEVLSDKYENILRFKLDQEDFKIYPQMVLFFEFVGNNAYMLEQMPSMLWRFKDSDIFLILDDSYEGLADQEFMQMFRDTLAQCPCITNWRILSSNYKMKDICENVFGSANNFVYFNIHLHLKDYDSINVPSKEFIINRQLRKKKFLCLNRQERYHRLMTIDFLLKEDIARHTYLSAILGEYGALIHDDEAVAWTEEAKAIRKFLDPDLNNLTLTQDQKERLSCLPLELDISESNHHAVKVNMPNVENYFNQSYFSILTEGDFARGEQRQMFTEKVLKCFLYGHPFIVIGLPGTLELLHERGFITFGNIIDESYDQEQDDEKRLAMALAEVKKLNRLNMNEMKNLYEKVMPILAHNFQTYKVLNSMPEPAWLANDLLVWYQDDS
jgi:hypothetical protein